MPFLGTLVARLHIDTTSIIKANAAVKGFSGHLTASLGLAAQRMRTFGYLASTTLTLPIVMAGKAAVETAKDYEFAIQKMVGLAGIAQKTANDWSKSILQMSKDVGRSPVELAEGLYFIASSGIKGARGLDILREAARAATAGLGETQGITDLLTSVLNAYAGSGLDAARSTDILVAAVREGKAEADEFANQIGKVVPLAAELGVGFDEVAGGLAAITLTGSNAAKASTYLRGIFNSLLKATVGGDKALKGMGSSYKELRTILREQGLIALMQKIRDLSVEYGEDVQSDVLPNIRALTGYLAIAGKNFEWNKEVMDRVRDSTGSMDEAWDAAAGTIQVKFNMALAAMRVSLVSMGQVISKAIIPILESLTEFLDRTAKWFDSLSEAQQKNKLRWVAFLAVLGPAAMIVSTMVYSLQGLFIAIKGLTMVLTGLFRVFALVFFGKGSSAIAKWGAQFYAVNVRSIKVTNAFTLALVKNWAAYEIGAKVMLLQAWGLKKLRLAIAPLRKAYLMLAAGLSFSMKSFKAWTRSAGINIALTKLLKNGMYTFTRGVKFNTAAINASTIAFKASSAALISIPWLAAAAAVIALGVAIVKLVKRKRELRAVEKELAEIRRSEAEQLGEQTTKLLILTKALEANNVPFTVRHNILKQYNNEYQDLLGYETTEKTSLEQINEQYDLLNEKIRYRLALESQMKQASKLGANVEEKRAVVFEKEEKQQFLSAEIEVNNEILATATKRSDEYKKAKKAVKKAESELFYVTRDLTKAYIERDDAEKTHINYLNRSKVVIPELIKAESAALELKKKEAAAKRLIDAENAKAASTLTGDIKIEYNKRVDLLHEYNRQEKALMDKEDIFAELEDTQLSTEKRATLYEELNRLDAAHSELSLKIKEENVKQQVILDKEKARMAVIYETKMIEKLNEKDGEKYKGLIADQKKFNKATENLKKQQIAFQEKLEKREKKLTIKGSAERMIDDSFITKFKKRLANLKFDIAMVDGESEKIAAKIYELTYDIDKKSMMNVKGFLADLEEKIKDANERLKNAKKQDIAPIYEEIEGYQEQVDSVDPQKQLEQKKNLIEARKLLAIAAVKEERHTRLKENERLFRIDQAHQFRMLKLEKDFGKQRVMRAQMEADEKAYEMTKQDVLVDIMKNSLEAQHVVMVAGVRRIGQSKITENAKLFKLDQAHRQDLINLEDDQQKKLMLVAQKNAARISYQYQYQKDLIESKKQTVSLENIIAVSGAKKLGQSKLAESIALFTIAQETQQKLIELEKQTTAKQILEAKKVADAKVFYIKYQQDLISKIYDEVILQDSIDKQNALDKIDDAYYKSEYKREQDKARKSLELDKKTLATKKLKSLDAGEDVDYSKEDADIKRREQLLDKTYQHSVNLNRRKEADDRDTMQGQLDLAQQERDEGLISVRQLDEEQRAIKVSYWDFLKEGPLKSSIFIKELNKDELRNIIRSAEDQIQIAKDKGATEIEIAMIVASKKEAIDLLYTKGALDRMRSFGTELKNVLANTLQDAFVTLGESLGKIAMGQGGIEEAFNSILNVFGNFLVQLGIAMITFSNLMIKLKQAIVTGQFELAIPVGIAAIAVGTALKALAAKGPQFESLAEGGFVPSPQLVMVGDAKDGKGEWVLNFKQMQALLKGDTSGLDGPILDAGGLNTGTQIISAQNYSGVQSPEVAYDNYKITSLMEPRMEETLIAEIAGKKLLILLKREESYQNNRV